MEENIPPVVGVCSDSYVLERITTSIFASSYSHCISLIKATGNISQNVLLIPPMPGLSHGSNHVAHNV